MKHTIRVNMTMFDFIKGLGMILVILFHSIPAPYQDGFAGACAQSVLMPIFFIVSGFWLKDKAPRDGIAEGARYLLIPYGYTVSAILLIGLVHRGLQGAWREWVDVFLLPLLLGHSGMDTRMGALWFIVALYWAWCIFYLSGMIRRQGVRTAVILLIGVLGGILLPLEPPFQIGQGMVAAVFVYFGYLVKRKKLLQTSLPLPLTAVLLAVWLAGVRFGSMDLAFYDVRFGILSVLCSTCGAYLLIRWVLRVNDYENGLLDRIRTVGRYSMHILCIHSLEIAVFPWNAVFRFTGESGPLRIVVQFLLRAAIIAVIWLMIRWIKKKRWSVTK